MPKHFYEMKKIGGKHMLFNSINFLIFFPAAVLSYYIVPYKVRYLWLLAVSYFFYYCFNPSYVVLLAASTAITYVGGLLLSRAKEKEPGGEPDTADKKSMWSKVIVAFSFLIHLGMLFFFKYFDFVIGNLFAVINAVDPDISKPGFNLLLPAGISFYTFKALSYIMDVYRGDIKAQRNPLKYGLYLSFFPQLAAGPIERASNFLKQLEEKHRLNLNQVRDGLLSIRDFWRRWHITLSHFLRDYIYIPLGGNRLGKKKKIPQYYDCFCG